MEKADGVLLSSKWGTMSTAQKHQLIRIIIAFERAFVSHPFGHIGSLYSERDLIPSDKSSPTRYPGFIAATPAFLDFEGPKPDEGVSAPSLPENFEVLSAAEQAQAKTLQTQQSLYKLYEIQSARQNKEVFNALQYSSSLGSQIISLVSQVFNDSEPIIRGQLIQLAQEWDRIVGKDRQTCPLSVTSDDIREQEHDLQKWEEGVQLMEDVLDSLGGVENGWQGWVSHEDYDQMRDKLAAVKEQFLDHMAGSLEEREAWSRNYEH
ncbi:hypothetical protein ATERTT37_000744 [Aspergillus terreus]